MFFISFRSGVIKISDACIPYKSNCDCFVHYETRRTETIANTLYGNKFGDSEINSGFIWETDAWYKVIFNLVDTKDSRITPHDFNITVWKLESGGYKYENSFKFNSGATKDITKGIVTVSIERDFDASYIGHILKDGKWNTLYAR